MMNRQFIVGYIVTVFFFLFSANSQEITDNSCLICHTPEGWIPLSIASQFNHLYTKFPLDGAHQHAECIQCHKGDTIEELHEFSNTDSNCNSCHLDIHFGSFGEDCERCHFTELWDVTIWGISHESTSFPLTGAHNQIDCIECHGVNFSRLSGTLTTECSVCHINVYEEHPAHTGDINCLLCHNTRSWSPSDMSHHDAFFPIYSGEHRGEWSTCSAECHINSDDYSDFSCGLNGVCHEHRQSEMDDEHLDEVSDYLYESQSCYDCHPNGEEDD